MKNFQDIVDGIGLRPDNEVVPSKKGANIIYKAVLDDQKAVSSIIIDAGNQTTATIDKTLWDPPATPAKGTDPATPKYGPNALILASDQTVMTKGSHSYAVSCLWNTQLRSCSGGITMNFYHDSDHVTTWVVETADSIVSDLQDYL